MVVINCMDYGWDQCYNCPDIWLYSCMTWDKASWLKLSGKRCPCLSSMCSTITVKNHPSVLRFPMQVVWGPDGPPGSDGSGNSSGWMIEDDFLLVLRYFVKHTKVCLEKKVLLQLDNRTSHISVNTFDYFKANGIVLLFSSPSLFT